MDREDREGVVSVNWRESVRRRLSRYLDANSSITQAELARRVGIPNRQRVSAFVSSGRLGAEYVRAIEQYLDKVDLEHSEERPAIVSEILTALDLIHDVISREHRPLVARLRLLHPYLEELTTRVGNAVANLEAARDAAEQ